MKILIAGSTGLVGSNLLAQSVADAAFEEIIILLRKDIDFTHPKVQKVIIDFENLEHELRSLKKVDAVFSCLGTTKAKTKDKDEYARLEIDYPTILAKWAKENETEQLHYISSIGANYNAKNSYLKNKGLAEQSLMQSGLDCIHLYRPSLITGDRKESRFLEKASAWIMNILNPILPKKYKKYQSIHAVFIAKAMLVQAKLKIKGTMIYESDTIKKIALHFEDLN